MSELVTPPFFLTYWNPFSENAPGLGQSFLNYVRDVSLANYTGSVVGKFVDNAASRTIAAVTQSIEDANEEQIDAIRRTGNLINETLIAEFSALDQRMALIQLEQTNANILLKDISKLLKLPDSEKQRQRNIELGLRFIKSAKKDEDLVIDATNEFNKALDLMPQDWFVMYQLGMCYLYFPKIQDLEKSNKYFLDAAKYSFVDDLMESSLGVLFNETTLLENYKGRIAEEEDIELSKNEVPNGFTSECYLQAALTNYIQAKFDDAEACAVKAVNNNSNSSKSWYLLAKYQARNKKYNETLSSLRSAAGINVSIYKFFAADRDLLEVPKLSALISELDKNYGEYEVENLKKQESDRDEAEFYWTKIMDGLGTYIINFICIDLLSMAEDQLKDIRIDLGLKVFDLNDDDEVNKLCHYIYGEIKNDVNFQKLLAKIYDYNRIKEEYLENITFWKGMITKKFDWEEKVEQIIVDVSSELEFDQFPKWSEVLPSNLSADFFAAKYIEYGKASNDNWTGADVIKKHDIEF